jgi:hypothetical protein
MPRRKTSTKKTPVGEIRRDIDLVREISVTSPLLMSMIDIPDLSKAKQVKTHFRPIKERISDYVFDIEGRYVVHVEYQDTKAADMGFRMVIYRVFLREHFGPDISIRQFVVYTGNEPGIGWDIRFQDEMMPGYWPAIDMRRLDPEPFLASENIDDNILAILCRDGTNPAIIQEVERRIEAMDETGKSQAYLKIILCGAVRKVEILAMLKNAEIDLSKYEDYPFVQKHSQAKIAEGERRVILLMLRRINPEVPQDILTAVEKADTTDLEKMTLLIMDQPSFEAFRTSFCQS